MDTVLKLVLDKHKRSSLKILVMFTLNLNVWLIFESARSIIKINKTGLPYAPLRKCNRKNALHVSTVFNQICF